MTESDFNSYYDHYFTKTRYIPNMARKLAQRDSELYNDLVQSALLVLWILKPEKAKKNKDAWIRQSLKFAMYRELSVLEPQKYVSLDTMLDIGFTLEQVEDGVRLGEPSGSRLHFDDGFQRSETEILEDTELDDAKDV